MSVVDLVIFWQKVKEKKRRKADKVGANQSVVQKNLEGKNTSIHKI